MIDRRNVLKFFSSLPLARVLFSGSAVSANDIAPSATGGWQNWSGSLSAPSALVKTPKSVSELQDILKTSSARPVGAGHSWTRLVPGTDTILKLDHFSGLGKVNAEEQTAWMGAGTRLVDLSRALEDHDLGFKNLGDINVQSLAGALSTATHGTGKNLPCLAAEVRGVRMVTGAGDVLEVSDQENKNLLPAVQVGLGALGVLTDVKMQLTGRYKLHRRVWFMPHARVLEEAERLWAENRNFEFFYIPFSDMSMCISHNETDAPLSAQPASEDEDAVMQLKMLRDYMSWFPALRKKLLALAIKSAPEEEVIGNSWEILSSVRDTKFNEMEYHLAPDRGLEALEAVRIYIERYRPDVFFPFEVRQTAGDTAWLSPFNDGPRISVAVHCYAPDDYAFLFTEIEPILRQYGGRPHWGKLNSLGPRDFAELYPQWEAFGALRRQLDPQGRLLNPYLTNLFENYARV